jgi:hypothetical protein
MTALFGYPKYRQVEERKEGGHDLKTVHFCEKISNNGTSLKKKTEKR